MTGIAPYREYKESGIDWAPRVPTHWSRFRVSDLVQTLNGYPFDSELFSEASGDYLVRIRDLNAIDTETRYQGEPVPQAQITGADVLIGMDGDFNVGRWRGEGTALLNQRMMALRGDSSVLTILEHGLQIPLEIINAQTYSTTVKHLSSKDVKKILFALPPTQGEIDAIADFLARETAEIDAFIADQEELVAVLQERRGAVITRAATSGIRDEELTVHPNLKGFEGIPAGWEETPLKRLGVIRYGIGEPPGYVDDGVPLIRATNVSRGKVTPDKMVYVRPSDIPAARIVWLEEGDVIVVRSGAYTGDSAIIPAAYAGAIAGFDMVFRAAPSVDPAFIQYALLSSYVKDNQLDVARERAAQPHLNAEELGNCRIVHPRSRQEQREVVVFLDHETSEIDAAIADAKEAIEVSKERRAALISAAVTGKIDVRNHVATMGV